MLPEEKFRSLYFSHLKVTVFLFLLTVILRFQCIVDLYIVIIDISQIIIDIQTSGNELKKLKLPKVLTTK